MLLYEIVARGAEQHADRPAIHFRGITITYAQLYVQVNMLASALRSRGIGHGDRVAVLLPNCPPFTVTYYACAALGAVCVPANPLLKPSELEWIWGDSDVKMVVTAPPFLDNCREAQAAVPTLKTIVSIGSREETPSEVLTFAELVAEGDSAPITGACVAENDPAVTIYTSGTEGRPKGALLSHKNLTVNCGQVAAVLHITENDNFLTALPLFHSFAGTVCQNTALYHGAASTYLEQFHPGRVLEAIADHACTLFPGVPAMYGALMMTPPEGTPLFKSIRLCVSGGAPMPAAVMEAFEKRFGVPIIEGDGPTECSPVTSVNPPNGVRKPTSVGLPVPGCEIRIFDDDDNELGVDEVGEIVVRGENVMLGYHNNPEATREAMRGGWYHTGDLGKIDSDGYIYIVDRKKDMLLVGGFNVYPREVEEVLYQHPAVQDAAVIGQMDALRGETALAVVSLRQGAEATDREIIHWCRERLANYKVPRRVLFRETLPRGGTGKVLKRLLRKELDMESGAAALD